MSFWLRHIVFLGLLCLPSTLYASPWKQVAVDPAEKTFIRVVSDLSRPGHVFAASRKSVYETQDGGKNWKHRFQSTAEAEITAIAYTSESKAIFAATTHGLYGSFDEGAHWSLLTRSAGEETAACTTIAVSANAQHRLALGTQAGLLLSTDGGKSWKRAEVGGMDRIVQAVFSPDNPDMLYVLTESRLFAGSLQRNEWQTMAASLTLTEDGASAEPEAGETSGESQPFFRTIVINPVDTLQIHLGTARGIRESLDGGKSWHWLADSGLRSTDIKQLLWQAHSPAVLYAATARGLFRYEASSQSWQPLSSPASSPAYDLAGETQGIWAASADGLFWYDATFSANPTASELESLLRNFVHEPTVEQVCQAAIRYAEVHPDKIRKWRRQAAWQALMPNVSFGYDRDSATDIHVDEGTFPNFQVLETTDRDAGFDFSITWDLGELIWNEDQTSIDNRSKLMVQLRDDLVNEVVRTYFERRRIQVALIADPPKNDQALLEKELRIQELTALIDGLTGGFFSEHAANPTNHGGNNG